MLRELDEALRLRALAENAEVEEGPDDLAGLGFWQVENHGKDLLGKLHQLLEKRLVFVDLTQSRDRQLARLDAFFCDV